MSIIVSAYFQIPSKQPHSFYLPQVSRFLQNIKNPIIFFTTPDLKTDFELIRGDLPIQFIEMNSIYDMNAFKKYGYDFWVNQCRLDVEKYHTPELAAIWYEKKEFVKKAIHFVESLINNDTKNDTNTNTYNLNTSVPFIWCDAGCIRTDNWIPEIYTFGNKIDLIPKDKIMFQLLHTLPHKQFFVFPDVYIAGAIICGYKESWINYSDLYDDMITIYVNNNICVNSDQYIWASVSLAYPDKFEVCNVKYNTVENWFFFLSYLS